MRQPFHQDAANMIKEIEAVNKAIIASLPEAVNIAGSLIMAEAQRRAPRGATGRLWQSGVVKDNPDVKTPHSAGVEIGFTSFYAGFVERGTSKKQALPFFRPAIDTKRGEAQAAVERFINAQIKRVTRQ